ncbi:glycosyltransferase family 4 protein [uncultured Tateyamaria sp.]|uniref:glycosyltransferase family 4 protein n=1 Tax=Tateyamaria sp. 1078 TaxID=3417464 RepID=UPI0026261779|nr:glycosyltransferase family 4 protein [uncultured Tateyamaria sp.]
MSIAFFAPLKPPTHPVPSGDRSVARAVMSALDHAGYDVCLASELRLYDGSGVADTQAQLAAQADAEIRRLCATKRSASWSHWLTYHNYYKAPDLIGPRVSAALNIPYLQVESTRARKRLTGPWSAFAAAAEAASDAARAIFYFTGHDAETLRRDAPAGQRLVHLPPFLNSAALPAPSDLSGPLLSVAMMRAGDKVASYQLIADALAMLPKRLEWHLNIAGDGPARAEVQALMAPFGPRVTFLGECDADALARHYATARALLWPGINEAFGMVYLEAQAAGVPVIAQDRPGVRDVVAGTHPVPAAGPQALAERIAALWTDPTMARAEGDAARHRMTRTHLLPKAAATLRQTIEAVT